MAHGLHASVQRTDAMPGDCQAELLQGELVSLLPKALTSSVLLLQSRDGKVLVARDC